MKHVCGFIAMACLAAAPLTAAQDVAQPNPSVQEVTPAIAKVIEIAKSIGMKTLVYSEFDEAKGVIGIQIVAKIPNKPTLVVYKDKADVSELMGLIRDEVKDSGKGGWRAIAIVVDKGGSAVSVQRGPDAGPIDGFNARTRAVVARAFPDIPKK